VAYIGDWFLWDSRFPNQVFRYQERIFAKRATDDYTAPPLRSRHSRPLETSLGTPLAMGKDKKKDVGAAQVRNPIGSNARRGFRH